MLRAPTLALVLALAVSRAASAIPIFDPTDFTSLGTATLSGTVTANTDTLNLDGFHGVLNQGVAVFDFDNFTIDAGADLVATGSNPLAILSRDTMVISGELDFAALSQVELFATNEITATSGSLIVLSTFGSLTVDSPGSIDFSGGGITIPEPASLAMFGTACAALWLVRPRVPKLRPLTPRRSPSAPACGRRGAARPRALWRRRRSSP
jgi:hypothetical protein